MRRYETIFIIDPDTGEEGRDQLFERTKSIIAAQNGMLVNFDEWGIRKLAYDIRKKPRGYYVCMDYCGSSDMVDEIERTFRLDDRYLKYMTVLIDAQADLEKIKAEIIEKEKAEQEATETTAETETPPAAESANKTEDTAAAESENTETTTTQTAESETAKPGTVTEGE